MTISLIPLPYAHDALAPAISAATLEKHHGAHHKGYVDKLNALVSGTELADQPLERIIAASRDHTDPSLFNQAAQVWNHGFYWHSLSPRPTGPDRALEQAANASFGSLARLKAELAVAATEHFGSGWAWLIADGDALSIETTHDAQTPADGKRAPLLVIDVWEHAYYLDHQNQRKAYVEAVVRDLLNWDFAAENFARAAPWIYPA